jgi:sugar phosphate permease
MAELQPPTRVRYLVVFVAFLTAVLLYLDRFCISYVQRYVKEDLGLNDDQLGWCFSAFFIAYALAQVPSGWLSDRFGARWMLTVYVLAWSAFTALMGLTAGFVSLLVLRAAVGVSQAGAYPTAAALIRRWVPFSARGQASSVVAFGGRFGGFIAPILTTYLVILFVPTTVPSEFREGDLLDPHSLAVALTDAETGAVTRSPSGEELREEEIAAAELRSRVFQNLSPEARQAVRTLSEDDAITAGSPGFTEAVQVLRADLNRLLRIDDLYRPGEFEGLALEREAVSLAAKETRTEDQTRRLNRLVLEAAFPESLRKVYGHGWRQVMSVYGAAGLAVALVFWLVFRERPADHPAVNEAERELIAANDAAAASGASRSSGAKRDAGGFPVRAILSSRSLWLMCLSQFGGALGWVFLMTWLPRYLFEVHRAPFVERGWMAAFPLFAGWFGMLLGGWLTDRVVTRRGLRWRTAPIVFGRAVAGVAYLAVIVAPSAWTATAAFAVIGFSNDLCNPASWAYKQDVGGRYVGAVLGWGNMWGSFGSAVSPVLLQYVIKHHGWDAAFVTAAAFFFLSAVAALGVDARIPVDRGDDVMRR